jgi:hypothetical protein
VRARRWKLLVAAAVAVAAAVGVGVSQAGADPQLVGTYPGARETDYLVDDGDSVDLTADLYCDIHVYTSAEATPDGTRIWVDARQSNPAECGTLWVTLSPANDANESGNGNVEDRRVGDVLIAADEPGPLHWTWSVTVVACDPGHEPPAQLSASIPIPNGCWRYDLIEHNTKV